MQPTPVPDWPERSHELAQLLARSGLRRDERYAYGDESPEALAHALDPRWRGELPRTYLFDGQGGHAPLPEMPLQPLPPAPVFKKGFERVCHRPEGYFIPRNLCFGHQGRFEGFLARFEVQVEDASPVDDVDLADVRDVDKGEHRAKFDPRTGFFQGFTQRGLSAGLVVFHEAGW